MKWVILLKEYYETLPQKLDEVDCSVILPSIAIPLYGTPLYFRLKDEGRLIDNDLSHYEGDHVLFRHKNLTAEEIFEAYIKVNKIFYSWKNILRRWLRFIRKQSIQESIPQFILKVVISTIIYFKLSIFQKHHAKERVFNRVKSKRKVELNKLKYEYCKSPVAV